MHKITAIGRLGRDPEMRYTPSGSAVTSFSVASDNRYKGEDQTEWLNVSVFGKLAEICNQYLQKGAMVYVEGPFKTRSYEGRDGETRFSVDLIGNSVQFLTGTAQPEESSYDDAVPTDDVDDLPF